MASGESPDDKHMASSKSGSRKAKNTPNVKPKAKPATAKAEKAKPKEVAKKAPASSPRPKAKPEVKGKVTATAKASGGAGAGGKQTTKEASTGAGYLIPGVAAAAAGRKPAQGKPVNPSYTGKTGGPTGPQGRMNTSVGRPSTGGGRPAIGNSARRLIGGGGGNPLMPSRYDEMRNMATGGMVSKQGPAKMPMRPAPRPRGK